MISQNFKIIEKKWAGRSMNLVYKGKSWIYNGVKVENDAIDFWTRKINLYGSKAYQKKRNINIGGLCFMNFLDLANILGDIQDLRFSILQ